MKVTLQHQGTRNNQLSAFSNNICKGICNPFHQTTWIHIMVGCKDLEKYNSQVQHI